MMHKRYTKFVAFAIAILFSFHPNFIKAVEPAIAPAPVEMDAEAPHLQLEMEPNDPILADLAKIEAASGEVVYVPEIIRKAVEIICKSAPEKLISPELKAISEVCETDAEIVTVSPDCAMKAMCNAQEILKSEDCVMECGPRAELRESIDRYVSEVESKDATICVRPEDSTRRKKKKCKVFCKVLVRDFLDAREIDAAGCIRARTLLTRNNACVGGNLLVKGNLKVQGQICGLTGLKGSTGATGATGDPGVISNCSSTPSIITGFALVDLSGDLTLPYTYNCNGYSFTVSSPSVGEIKVDVDYTTPYATSVPYVGISVINNDGTNNIGSNYFIDSTETGFSYAITGVDGNPVLYLYFLAMTNCSTSCATGTTGTTGA